MVLETGFGEYREEEGFHVSGVLFKVLDLDLRAWVVEGMRGELLRGKEG
jgi:hypothetical protein